MPTDQPNVLFVFSDQHRGSAMHCAGDPNVETPAMDRLSAEGVRARNCYANDPVCTPSRGCILTGQYPFENGAFTNGMPLRPDAPTIAKAFNEAGYRTACIGKWHLDGTPQGWIPPGPRRQGFEDYWAINHSYDYFDVQQYFDDPEPVHIDGYSPEVQTDLALDFIDENRHDPFCLVLALGPPHSPYEKVPEHFRERYDPDDLELLPNVEPVLGGPRWIADPDAYPDQEAIIRETTRDYYAQITAIDEQLGRLLTSLDESDLAEDTIVVYTSDHGDMLWSNAREQKAVPWNEATNIPFLVRWPGEIPTDEVTDTLLSTVDMTPTVLSLAGHNPPDSMQGTDLSAAIRGEDVSTPDSVYLMRCASSGSPHEWRAVRTERHLYAELLDGTPWLLYDDETDPYQRTNLVFDSDYRETRVTLADELDGWRTRLDDPMLQGEALADELGTLEEFYTMVGYMSIHWD